MSGKARTARTAKKRATTKRRPGQPTAYRASYAERAYQFALLGATDVQMAELFGVNPSTIDNWKAKHPEFLRSITHGKGQADAQVAERLYQRACGYSHPAVKIFMPAGSPKPIYADYVEHYPPDTQAASLWLRNRQPARWRDKQHHELTGKDGERLESPQPIINVTLTKPEPDV